MYLQEIIDEKTKQPLYRPIGLGKSGYRVNSFLISRQKHMLWVLIRSASSRHF